MLEERHIALRKGKTRPLITRHLSASKEEFVEWKKSPNVPRALKKSDHNLVDLLDEVPFKNTGDGKIHAALGILHQNGRLAALYDELRATVEGKEWVVSEEKPDLESALFHFQKGALFGDVECMMICAQLFSGFEPRDYLPDMNVTDEKRALYYLELAAQRKHRSALCHLADLSKAMGKDEKALEYLLEAYNQESLPDEAPESWDKSLPYNVWPNSPDKVALFLLLFFFSFFSLYLRLIFFQDQALGDDCRTVRENEKME